MRVLVKEVNLNPAEPQTSNLKPGILDLEPRTRILQQYTSGSDLEEAACHLDLRESPNWWKSPLPPASSSLPQTIDHPSSGLTLFHPCHPDPSPPMPYLSGLPSPSSLLPLGPAAFPSPPPSWTRVIEGAPSPPPRPLAGLLSTLDASEEEALPLVPDADANVDRVTVSGIAE